MIIPVFLLAPVGISRRVQRVAPAAGLCAGILIGSLGCLVLAARLAAAKTRTDVTAHVYGNNVPAIMAYTLVDHAARVPADPRCRPSLADRRGGGDLDRNHQASRRPFAGLIRRFIPEPASMTVFGAAMYSYLALVLLQRVFDQPLVGMMALAIVDHRRARPRPHHPMADSAVSSGVAGPADGRHRHRLRASRLAGDRPALPLVASPAPLRAFAQALPYLSVIAPMAIYQVLQDIASVEGAAAAGDDYDARAVVLLRRTGHVALRPGR